MSGEAPPVQASGLVKRYGQIVAVDHVDLSVHAGDVYGFLGPNGAGKTTTLRMALGLIAPTEGSVQLFGRDPMREGARALQGVAGFVEAPRFYPYLSGRKNLELLAALDGEDARERIDEVLTIVELAPRAGQRQRQRPHRALLGLEAQAPLAGGHARDARLRPRDGERPLIVGRVQQVARAALPAQVRERALVHHPPGVDDRHAVAQLLNLGQLMA